MKNALLFLLYLPVIVVPVLFLSSCGDSGLVEKPPSEMEVLRRECAMLREEVKSLRAFMPANMEANANILNVNCARTTELTIQLWKTLESVGADPLVKLRYEFAGMIEHMGHVKACADAALARANKIKIDQSAFKGKCQCSD